MSLQEALNARFSDAPDVEDHAALIEMAARGSCRVFTGKPVPPAVLKMLCAVALSSPTKSDLQQRDIIVLEDPAQRTRLSDLVGGQAWVADAPMLAVFCGNNRRQRRLHEKADIPFANDHLDAFFNAVGDAAIALGAFTAAADALGLGTCPISAVRNEARAVARLLDLPDHVFPFAGLAIGYPAREPQISKRLPLSATVHMNRYGEDTLDRDIAAYDAERAAAQPFGNQRFQEVFGVAETYAWSQDKVRQYSQPERSEFGAYVRSIGFILD